MLAHSTRAELSTHSDNMDETPVLARHPLHTAHKFKPKLPLPEPTPSRGKGSRDVSESEDSETEGESLREEEGGEVELIEGKRGETSLKGNGSVWLEEEEDLPSTQVLDPRPLAGLYVYVDVRSGPDGCENRSAAISHQLANLGATVCARFTKDVTHVVFKDGKMTTKERAEKKKVFLVSPLWVEASKRANDRVSEAKYPVLCGSDSPVILGKIKRIKSMQPKPLEDEITKSLERSRKRHKSDDRATMAKRRALPALPSATTPLSSLSSSTALDPPDSDDEDNLDLPVIKLPGTPPIAEAEMETGGGGATGVPITPEAVTQRTKAKKIADTAVEGVASNKEGGASKRRSNRQSAGTGAQAGANEKKRSSRQSSDPKAKKVKTDGSCCGATVKEPKTVSKKTTSLKRSSLNQKGSKVTKKTPPTKKKQPSLRQVLSTGKENTDPDATPDLKDLIKEKELVVEKPKRRRRVNFKSSSVFERKKPTLVLTSVQPEDQDLIVSIVDRLGRFEVSRTVCDTTMHVVCGNPRRTINILAATAMGCWILSTDWVWQSVERGQWLGEESFEMSDHFPSARLYRLERQGAGMLYKPKLFSPAGSIFVSSSCTNPPAQQLERLLTLTGGKVTGSQRKADVCVGGKSWNMEVKSVTEQWILDSITEHQLLPPEDYLLDGPRSRAAGSPEL